VVFYTTPRQTSGGYFKLRHSVLSSYTLKFITPSSFNSGGSKQIKSESSAVPEVLTAVTIKFTVIRNVTPLSLVTVTKVL
jgi:hypothetical protein